MHWPLFFASLFAGLRLAAFALFLLAFALPWIILGA